MRYFHCVLLLLFTGLSFAQPYALRYNSSTVYEGGTIDEGLTPDISSETFSTTLTFLNRGQDVLDITEIKTSVGEVQNVLPQTVNTLGSLTIDLLIDLECSVVGEQKIRIDISSSAERNFFTAYFIVNVRDRELLCGIDSIDPVVTFDHIPFIPGFRGQDQYNGSYYYSSINTFSATNIQSHAQSLGGNVISISDATENAIAGQVGGSSPFIGLSDAASEGNFVWFDGTPLTYTNWFSGFPRNVDGTDDYVVMNVSDQWVDVNAQIQRPYILEVPVSSWVQTSGAGFNSGDTFPCGTTLIAYELQAPSGTYVSELPITIIDHDIDQPDDVYAGCDFIFPEITGPGLTGNEQYYTGPNGTGTAYNEGDQIDHTTFASYPVTIYITDPSLSATCGSPVDEVSFQLHIGDVKSFDEETLYVTLASGQCSTVVNYDVPKFYDCDSKEEGFEAVVEAFNIHHTEIANLIPNGINIHYGGGSSSYAITGDGFRSPYDRGNMLTTDTPPSTGQPTNFLRYRDGAVFKDALLGVDGTDYGSFTTKSKPKIFMAAVDLINTPEFSIAGDLNIISGATGPAISGYQTTVSQDGETYTMLTKTVYGAGVNGLTHLFLVPGTLPAGSNSYPNDVSNDNHTISNLPNQTELYYLMFQNYSGGLGQDIPLADLEAIATKFIETCLGDLDEQTGTVTQVAGLPPGSVFPAGTTVNTFEYLAPNGAPVRTNIEVVVEDPDSPVITLNGFQNERVVYRSTYQDAGATATDSCDGNLTVTVSGSIDTQTTGVQQITYEATDSSGNVTEEIRTVEVVAPDFIYDQGAWSPRSPADVTLPSGVGDIIAVYEDVTVDASAIGVLNCDILYVHDNATLTFAPGFAVINPKRLDNRGTIMGSEVQLNLTDASTDNQPHYSNLTVIGDLRFGILPMTLEGRYEVAKLLEFSTNAAHDFSNAEVILRSDANNTGYIDYINGDLSMLSLAEEVTVQRYISGSKRYRFLSSPVNTTGTIYDNLQEGGDDSLVGFGTHITGAGGSANGFDDTATNQPSMFGYGGDPADWFAVTSTDGPSDQLGVGDAYRIFVRGDRQYDLTQTTDPNRPTVLQMTGTVHSGDFQISDLPAAAGDYYFLGNPFQAPYDLAAALSNQSGGVPVDADGIAPTAFYAWDSQQGSLGSYVTYDISTGLTNVSSSPVNGVLQPGQAVFVESSGLSTNATLKPSDIDLTQGQIDVFSATEFNSLYVSLSHRGIRQDETLILLDAEGLGKNSLKFQNPGDNIAARLNGKMFSIIKTDSPSENFYVPLAISTRHDRELTLDFSAFTLPEGLEAYLMDLETGEEHPIDHERRTSIPIQVQESSSGNDQFVIIMKNSMLDNNPLFTVYPNPVSEGQLFLSLPDSMKNASISMTNILGQNVEAKALNTENGMRLNLEDFASGVYFLNVIDGENSIVKKIVVK